MTAEVFADQERLSEITVPGTVMAWTNDVNAALYIIYLS
jgi:hypothetical protein